MWRYNPLTGNLDKVGLINVAPLCTITLLDWDIPPDNINLAVDRNPDTATGIGQKTTSGSGTIGRIHLESPKGVYLTGMVFSSWSDGSGKVRLSLYLIDTGGIWHHVVYLTEYLNKTSEFKRCGGAAIVTVDNTFEKILFRFIGDSADTYYIRIYEIFLLRIM